MRNPPVTPQIRLSMCTANKLEGSLSALKRRLGLTFIKFEDAAVELEPFVRAHVFDTASYLGRQMLAHFKDVSEHFHHLVSNVARNSDAKCERFKEIHDNIVAHEFECFVVCKKVNHHNLPGAEVASS